MAQKPKGPAVLTANDLWTGAIVYWSGRRWTRDVGEALRAETEEARLELEARGKIAEDASHVVGAYLIHFDPATGAPVALRERHRLAGPSVSLPA